MQWRKNCTCEHNVCKLDHQISNFKSKCIAKNKKIATRSTRFELKIILKNLWFLHTLCTCACECLKFRIHSTWSASNEDSRKFITFEEKKKGTKQQLCNNNWKHVAVNLFKFLSFFHLRKFGCTFPFKGISGTRVLLGWSRD